MSQSETQLEAQATPENPQRPRRRDFIDKFIDKRLKGASNEVKGALLVVVVLITASSYQTTLSPPGGVWQDDLFSPADNSHNTTTDVSHNTTTDVSNSTTRYHTAGDAVMALNSKPEGYRTFVTTNSLGFYLSVSMIYMITNDFPMVFELQLLMLVLSINFLVCVIQTIPADRYTELHITYVTMPLIFIATFFMLAVRSLLKDLKL